MVNTALPIFSLPTEVLWEIFRVIPDNKSKAQFSLSCKGFYDIAEGFKCFVERAYKSEQTALLNAVAMRGMSPEKAEHYHIPLRPSTNSNGEQGDPLAVENAVQAFYEVFKRRCVQLNAGPNSGEFKNYFDLAVTVLTKQIESPAYSNSETDLVYNQVKMEIAIQRFHDKTYQDMIDELISLPAESITMDKYDKKAKDILRIFSQSDIYLVEAFLRRDLKAKHNQDFKRLSLEFWDPNPANPKVVKIQEDLKLQFEAEKTVIEAELSTLCGTSGWNGTIYIAAEKRSAARFALNHAQEDFLRSFSATTKGIALTSSLEALLALDFIDPSEEFLSAKETLAIKLSEYHAARDEYDDLIEKRSELVDELAQVKSNLNPENLYYAARLQAERSSSFYYELNIPMSQNNIHWRYDRMHQIISDQNVILPGA